MGNISETSRYSYVEHVEAPMRRQGVLTILAGPTASGKSNVLEGLVAQSPNMKRVISTTTRPIRDGEVNGVDYHFLSSEAFQAKAQQGGFLETVQYGKNFYGTQLSDIEPVLAGQDLCWIVNMGRAIEIEEFYRKTYESETAQSLVDRTLLVLIGVPSLLTLRERFRSRGSTDDFVNRIQEDWAVWKNNQDKFENVIINRNGLLQDTIESTARLIEERRNQLR